MTDRHGYPRPQLQRAGWQSLNGFWQYAPDPEGRWAAPGEIAWQAMITVPFAPETPASGIGDTGFGRAYWYRRAFDTPVLTNGERLLLHFGAVDYSATVWLNGDVAVRHEGGYTPFSVDITDLLRRSQPQQVVVRAEDDPCDLAKPRGKQDWQQEPHGIWYPRTSGIWQTVWLEVVPRTHIDMVAWSSSLDRWEIGLEARLGGDRNRRLRLHSVLSVGSRLLVDDYYTIIEGEVSRRLPLSDPGIDDFRNELLWSPDHPTLIDAHLELVDGETVIDTVTSYTALRSVGTQGDRFILNGRPLTLRLVLDQGIWPETGLTPPGDDALRRDVELARAMGFNGVRKHQKIEDPRYFYWADRLGLLVWEEMPSAYRFTRRSVERLVREWTEALDRDSSHPSIVTLTPFNESWGVPSLPGMEPQRQCVRAMYHLTKTLDPERPVVGNDGWEAVATDIIGIHDYDDDPRQLARRYALSEGISRLIQAERPGGRLLAVEGYTYAGQPIVLSEFGGIGFYRSDGHAWGYSHVISEEEFAERYEQLLAVVRDLRLFAGFCYTQFVDTYQEENGLLYADRRPKIPLERIAAATRGDARYRTEPLAPDPRARV